MIIVQQDREYQTWDHLDYRGRGRCVVNGPAVLLARPGLWILRRAVVLILSFFPGDHDDRDATIVAG